WSRPCVIPTRFSLRVSTHRSARPVCLAAQATRIASRSIPTLAPKPPPTSGATTRMASGSRPKAPAMINRLIWAFWVLTHTVSLPPVHMAAAARPSMGTGATRWFTMSRETTTSQPSNAVSPAGWATATFDPASGNSSVCPVHDRGEGLIVHADQLGGVLALVAVVGQHHGHRLTHEPHPVHRQQRL